MLNRMKTFFDVADTIDPEIPPPPRVTNEVITPRFDRKEDIARRYSEAFEYGTTPSPLWSDEWVNLVIQAEQDKGRAVCGARRKSNDLATLIDENVLTTAEIEASPITLVCKSPAGLNTDHPGEGRCIIHGGMVHTGTMTTGRSSLLRHNKLSPRVHEFFEMEGLLDLRNAISIIYAAVDEMLGEDEEITPARAQEISNMMSKVGGLVKQHNEITASKQISIEVPEFMAWAEFFYELAIKYIQDGKGNVGGFLTEAQQFYNATVTLTLGDADTQAQARRDSAGALGQGSGVEVVGVSRTGVEES